MDELTIPRVEKEDIAAPHIAPGGTTIVLQRHEKYNRDRSADDAGSISPENSGATIDVDRQFFEDVLAQEQTDGAETVVLFVSSDTQYAGKGRRSLETGQLAQDTAAEVFAAAGIDPAQRIINFNPNFNTHRSSDTDQDIRPMRGIVEPKMFDEHPEFVKELGRMFNPPELQEEIDARRTDVQLSPRAFGAYEEDAPEVKELRERHGAEGVHDIVDRTKKSISVLERYSRFFHAKNPDKRLVIWATSHYDTISPLVKDAQGADFGEYVPVDYGAGIVMNIEPGSTDVELQAQKQKIALPLGRIASTDLG